jgi:hypothetical protein
MRCGVPTGLSLSCAVFLACSGSPPTRAAIAAPPPVSTGVSSLAPPDGSDPVRAETGGDAGTTASVPTSLTFTAVVLPGAIAPASLDYIAYEGPRGRVWVPVGNTGRVDVWDIATASFAIVDGFPTGERDFHGKKRTIGPSAVTMGDGVAYVGNRATNEVCSVDRTTLKRGVCLKLASPTDGVAFVAATKEVWVTMPHAKSIAVLDASHPGSLKMKTTITLDGAPEGYATDASRGLFFTNLEDVSRTLAIDLKSHQRRATWRVDCGSDGPRGIAADAARGFVYVACTDHVVVLDGARDGATLATTDTGGGLDNIDWLESRHLLYAAAAKAGKATILRIDDNGQPTVVATGALPEGSRNGVADATGNAYVTDPVHGRLLVMAYAP